MLTVRLFLKFISKNWKFILWKTKDCPCCSSLSANRWPYDDIENFLYYEKIEELPNRTKYNTLWILKTSIKMSEPWVQAAHELIFRDKSKICVLERSNEAILLHKLELKYTRFINTMKAGVFWTKHSLRPHEISIRITNVYSIGWKFTKLRKDIANGEYYRISLAKMQKYFTNRSFFYWRIRQNRSSYSYNMTLPLDTRKGGRQRR